MNELLFATLYTAIIAVLAFKAGNYVTIKYCIRCDDYFDGKMDYCPDCSDHLRERQVRQIYTDSPYLVERKAKMPRIDVDDEYKNKLDVEVGSFALVDRGDWDNQRKYGLSLDDTSGETTAIAFDEVGGVEGGNPVKSIEGEIEHLVEEPEEEGVGIPIELIEAIYEARKEWNEEIHQLREELKNNGEENGLPDLERFAQEAGQEEDLEGLFDSMIVEADEEQDDEEEVLDAFCPECQGETEIKLFYELDETYVCLECGHTGVIDEESSIAFSLV